MEDPAFPFKMSAVIECERGTLDFRMGRDAELVVRTSDGERALVPGADYPLGTGYDFEVRAMLTAIADGHAEAPVSLSDAAHTQRLIDHECAQLNT